MEKINLRVNSAPAMVSRDASLCGVVGSGNLEILFRKGDAKDACLFEVNTSANGFSSTWESVLHDFAENNAVGGLSVAINDMGATPAVVTLRLGQGLAMFMEAK
ncbi:MAG: malonate decarboxylase acyl carrier protein [Fluviibacter sp.]